MEAEVTDRPPSSLEGAPTGEGLTYEKVWAMFQETDREIEKMSREFQEMSRESDRKFREMREETDRLMKEVTEQQKETERRQKETARQMKETDRLMKETDRRMGYLNNRFGELAEHLVAPAIFRKFNELGYHFEAMYKRGYEVPDDTGRAVAEVDILLENGGYYMAVEVKSKPHIKDIKHHVKRLELLRKYRNKHNDTRKIQGAIAGAIFPSEEKKAVIKAGFFVVEQSGDTVRIDVPDGFVPREW